MKESPLHTSRGRSLLSSLPWEKWHRKRRWGCGSPAGEHVSLSLQLSHCVRRRSGGPLWYPDAWGVWNCSFVFLIDFIFFLEFRGSDKMGRKYREIPICTHGPIYTPHPMCSLPAIHIPTSMFLCSTIHEPALTCHYHPGPRFPFRVPLDVVHSTGFDTCIHHNNSTQSSCTVLKIPWALPISLALPP